ncbi:MAG: hypothetical protein NTY53_15535, partial [Kiritimatiellaeota bacterium]|nr:hypothetical protein [Kiritimatiellota bacterium]
MQQELLTAERTGQHAAAKKIVTLASDVVAQLALLRKDVNSKNHGRIKKLAEQITQHAALAWAHEVAPELTLPHLADPPSDKPVTLKAGKGEPYTFYPLGKLEAQLKAKGDISKVIALRDEIDRAQGSANPLATKATLPEAQQVQQELLAAERAGQQTAAKKLVTLAGEAITQLALVRKDVNAKNHDRIKHQAEQITQ